MADFKISHSEAYASPPTKRAKTMSLNRMREDDDENGFESSAVKSMRALLKRDV